MLRTFNSEPELITYLSHQGPGATQRPAKIRIIPLNLEELLSPELCEEMLAKVLHPNLTELSISATLFKVDPSSKLKTGKFSSIPENKIFFQKVLECPLQRFDLRNTGYLPTIYLRLILSSDLPLSKSVTNLTLTKLPLSPRTVAMLIGCLGTRDMPLQSLHVSMMPVSASIITVPRQNFFSFNKPKQVLSDLRDRLWQSNFIFSLRKVSNSVKRLSLESPIKQLGVPNHVINRMALLIRRTLEERRNKSLSIGFKSFADRFTTRPQKLAIAENVLISYMIKNESSLILKKFVRKIEQDVPEQIGNDILDKLY